MWLKPIPSGAPASCWPSTAWKTKSDEINLAAAELAREVAAEFSARGKPRFVAGSMGPTTKLPSLGHISFDDMAAAYAEQASALIAGGVDVLLVETCQDILQAKAALAAVFDAMQPAGKRIPVTVQVTLEATGTMLLGTEIGAALTALEPFDVDIIGMNCATGPKRDERRGPLSRRQFDASTFPCCPMRDCRKTSAATRCITAAAGTRATTTSTSSRTTECALWAAVAALRPST